MSETSGETQDLEILTFGISSRLGRLCLSFALIDDGSFAGQVKNAVNSYVEDAHEEDYGLGGHMDKAMNERIVDRVPVKLPLATIEAMKQLAETYETTIDTQVRASLYRYFDKRGADPALKDQILKAKEETAGRDKNLSSLTSLADARMLKRYRKTGFLPQRKPKTH